jgi:uncharacterized repeat protein (TIGR03803 family)
VFELTPPSTSNGSWTETILWNFGNRTDGQSPLAGLIMDASGNFYGTTEFGGTNAEGTVFEVSNHAVFSGEILLNAERIEFPNTALGSTSTFQLVVRNTGTSQLTGTVNPPPAPFDLSGSGSFNLAPQMQTTINMTFTPTAATRVHRTDTVVSSSQHNGTVNLDLGGPARHN